MQKGITEEEKEEEEEEEEEEEVMNIWGPFTPWPGLGLRSVVLACLVSCDLNCLN